jgi:hypothetical protein
MNPTPIVPLTHMTRATVSAFAFYVWWGTQLVYWRITP